jgi:hypothetical protein
MTTALRRPGVEIAQEFVTTNPTVSLPTLGSLIMGPCFRVIDAFDDDGEPQSEAYAGTYQDGYGTVAYDLPSLGDEDSLSTLTDELRVFLVLGDVSRELNSVGDEETLDTGTGTGTYNQVAATFVDGAAAWVDLGVEAGDVVRVTWRGETVDIPVTVDAVAQGSLTVDNTLIPENLAAINYEIIRNPAEFVFDATAQANYIIGVNANYIEFDARALKLDGVTEADYAGADGDDLTIEIAETAEISSGTDSGYIGDTIFTVSLQNFETDIPATAMVPTTDTYISISANPNGGTGIGEVLRQVLMVATDEMLLIETGEGTLASQDWVIGSLVSAYSTQDAVYTHAPNKEVVINGESFLTSIPQVGGPGTAPATDTYIELAGDGVYQIATVESNTAIRLDGVINPGGDVTVSDWTIIKKIDGAPSNGNTASDKTFVDPTATFITDGVTAVAGECTLDLADGSDYNVVDSVDSEIQLTLTDSAVDGVEYDYEVVDTTVALDITWMPDTEKVVFTLPRVGGESTITYAALITSLTSALDASYNATVAEFLTGSVTGAGTLTDANVGEYVLDGGADDDQLILDADLIGSTSPVGLVYVSYRALRLDVTASAAEPSMLEYESTSDLEDDLSPITTDNPLALGMYFAMLNAPSRTIYGLGIDEISATKPDGTLDAYTEGFEFLEGQDVYSIVPLTQDPTVHAVGQTHVDTMSSSDNKSERILLMNQAFPAYATATTLASGTSGNTGTFDGQAAAEFSTSVDLIAAGVKAALDAGHDVYLVVSSLATSDDAPDEVKGTQGLYGLAVTQVKIGDNFVLVCDGTETAITTDWDNLVDVTWTVYQAGAAITAKADQRDAIAAIGENFADRRVFHIWPSDVVADVNGSSTNLEGFYLAAAVSGWIAEQPPAKGLTNSTVNGFTGLKYSNNYFSESQMEIIAGGGTMIFEQFSSGGSLKCRHQLSTDTSTVQYRELSITKAIDYTAKFFRNALSSQIGVFNITQSFLDSLAVRIKGLGSYLVSAKILADFNLDTIEVDSTDPSKVNIVAAIDVFYPCNTIYMTLEI